MRQAEKHAIVAERVFDGTAFADNAAVIIEGRAYPRRGPVAIPLPANMPRYALSDGACLVPGFIDVQVNGVVMWLFQRRTHADGIRSIAAAHRRYGTTALLPTLITDAPRRC